MDKIEYTKMFRSNKYFFSFLISLVLLILGFLISYKSLMSPLISGDMDGYARANWGYARYVSGEIFSISAGGAWLPLHSTILALSYFIFKDPLFAPRALTLILNILSIPIMYFYTKNLFTNKPRAELISIVSAIIYLILPLRLILATQPLSEPISMLLLLLILLFIYSKKTNYLLVIIFTNLATTIRFEFWFFLPIILLIFGSDKSLPNWKRITYTFFCCIFPVYWMILNQFQLGNFLAPFMAVYLNAQIVAPEVPYHNPIAASFAWLQVLIEQIGVSGLLLYLLSLFKLSTNKEAGNLKVNLAIVFPLYFTALLITQVSLGAREWLGPRYLFPVFVTIIPFISSSLVSIFEILFEKKTRGFIFCLVICILLLVDFKKILSNMIYFKQTVPSEYTNNVFELVSFYKQNYKDNPHIVYINQGQWLFPMFEYLTQNHNITEIGMERYKDIEFNEDDVIIKSSNDTNLDLIENKKILFQNRSFTIFSHH